ncbi:MAG: hypothetical protein IKO41_06100 [Lachnospiraceae bacterium]|nr:hypothetical protein [Lachnospiraceae bacterium]
MNTPQMFALPYQLKTLKKSLRLAALQSTCLLMGFLMLFCCLPAEVQAQELNAISIQGTWQGSNGQNSLTLVLQGQSCALTLNGQTLSGVWSLAGNQLIMHFANGKNVRYQVSFDGQTLTLDGTLRLMRTMPQSQPMPGMDFGGSQTSPLDGLWFAQTPQGARAFRFQGNFYAQLLNGQVMEEGQFSLSPDGRFFYRVTSGPYAGQSGENRVFLQGQTLTMSWPDGSALTYQREVNATPTPSAQSPLEGRWVWAKNGPVTFGFIFSGNRFISLWNNAEKSRGTFQISGPQLVMHHETGPDAGKTDVLGFQLSQNRLLIFVMPDQDPIPYVRQGW